MKSNKQSNKQKVKLAMETQLFIYLKYLYEPTGQQKLPTHTF